jgi:acetate kinase
MAPLHNGAALRVMRWLAAQQPDLEQWACFDIAFHATLPAEAATYAIPADWRHQGLRRFGCHGLSHQHVAEAVDQLPPGRRLLPVRHRGGTKRGHHHGLHPA